MGLQVSFVVYSDSVEVYLWLSETDKSLLCSPISITAANMRIHLYRINPTDNSRIFLNEFITNSDGRLSSGPALKGKDFVAGVYYEWIFFVGDYFAQLPHLKTSGTPFLNEVPIRFGMDDPDEHYHVPLLVSPFGFSTYRGS